MYDIKWKILKSILDMECTNFTLHNEVSTFSEKFMGKISPPVTSWITEYVHVQLILSILHT